MCTIILMNHHYKEFSLVIAANRDEDISRPSSHVQILSKEPQLIIGGKDELKGGTWLGVNKNSLFVAITNQGEKNPKLASRGLLVMEALKCKTLSELVSFVEEIDPSKYNKFNLVFGNVNTIFIAHSYLLHSMVINELPHGIHVVSSDMKFSGPTPKVEYVHNKLNNVVDAPWLEYYKLLKKTLASTKGGLKIKPKKRESGALTGNCTVSSSILAFSDKGLERYKFHDRTEKRKKKSDRNGNEPFVPRYKDYIDLWRDPDGLSTPTSNSEESSSDDDGEDELTPKEEIMKSMKMMRKRISNMEDLARDLNERLSSSWRDYDGDSDDD